MAEKWKLFKNIELWEYCLSLPLDGYVKNYDKSDVKAKHVFTHRIKSKGDITVWGLDNTHSKASPDIYFTRYYAGAKKRGLIIEHSNLDASAGRFYGWGYWSKTKLQSRFLEIVWLHDSEVIKFHTTFPIADSALWKARLPQLLQQSSLCKADER